MSGAARMPEFSCGRVNQNERSRSGAPALTCTKITPTIVPKKFEELHTVGALLVTCRLPVPMARYDSPLWKASNASSSRCSVRRRLAPNR